MREIKFRAWDKNKKKWVSRNNWLGGALSPNIDFISKCSVWKGWDIEIMQYTGLKIKNIEVYEGDLIKVRKDYIYEVKFKNGAFYLYHYNKYVGLEENENRWGLLNRLFDTDMQDIFKECKVIGNIYDPIEE